MSNSNAEVERVQKAVMRAVAAAANYFIIQQQLSFVEIGDKLEMFLTSVLKLEEGFDRVGAKLHEHPDGNYFDIGVLIGGAMAGLRLLEVEIGKTTKSTLH